LTVALRDLVKNNDLEEIREQRDMDDNKRMSEVKRQSISILHPYK